MKYVSCTHCYHHFDDQPTNLSSEASTIYNTFELRDFIYQAAIMQHALDMPVTRRCYSGTPLYRLETWSTPSSTASSSPTTCFSKPAFLARWLFAQQ